MKISISAQTFSLDDYIILDALEAGSNYQDLSRRVNKTATLDTGIVIQDNGWSHGDRTFTFQANVTQEQYNTLYTLHKNYYVLTLTTPDGAYQGNFSELRNENGLVTITFMVESSLSEWVVPTTTTTSSTSTCTSSCSSSCSTTQTSSCTSTSSHTTISSTCTSTHTTSCTSTCSSTISTVSSQSTESSTSCTSTSISTQTTSQSTVTSHTSTSTSTTRITSSCSSTCSTISSTSSQSSTESSESTASTLSTISSTCTSSSSCSSTESTVSSQTSTTQTSTCSSSCSTISSISTQSSTCSTESTASTLSTNSTTSSTPPPPTEGTFYPTQSSDDWVYNASDFNNSDNTDDVGRDGGGTWIWSWGCIFKSINIPNGATIDSAKITITAGDSDSGTSIAWQIRGQDEDTATTPTSRADVIAFNLTTASVAWNNEGAWTTDNTYDSPDIATIIKEIVDRVGWVAGNDIQILVRENGSSNGAFRNFSNIDRGSAYKAALYIDWS